MAQAETPSPTPLEPEPKGWSPLKLTGLGLVTLLIALSVIVFMATRLTTCMYLDGSQ